MYRANLKPITHDYTLIQVWGWLLLRGVPLGSEFVSDPYTLDPKTLDV